MLLLVLLLLLLFLLILFVGIAFGLPNAAAFRWHSLRSFDVFGAVRRGRGVRRRKRLGDFGCLPFAFHFEFSHSFPVIVYNFYIVLLSFLAFLSCLNILSVVATAGIHCCCFRRRRRCCCCCCTTDPHLWKSPRAAFCRYFVVSYWYTFGGGGCLLWPIKHEPTMAHVSHSKQIIWREKNNTLTSFYCCYT